jgi:hypothetical protein
LPINLRETQHSIHPIIWHIRESVSSGRRLIQAEPERMVMTEGLVIRGSSVMIHHSSNALNPIAEDMFQFRPLNFIEKRLNAIRKIWWLNELLSRQCALHVIEKPEVQGR